ncbi:MAG TPA: DUF1552 domain-containing protein [Acidobacteria bacterium]|nr:DUF1552 domain-containing protein [Acidobacteriota bacterium]
MIPSVNRRTFLRASGVALALPMLESMHPALARAVAASPKRMLNICNTLGLYSDSWFPTTAGAGYEATEYLSLIDAHRDKYTLFSGYAHEEQSGRQPHNSEITFLTSARRPGLDGFRNTISVDQVAANHLGYVTRFPSLVLGTLTAQSQSFTTSGAMVPAETSPAELYRKLFLQGTPEEIEREAQSLDDGGSILDRLKTQTTALRRRVSATDQRTLDAYFDAVRTAEEDLGEVQAWQQRAKPVVDAAQPDEIPNPADLVARVKAMFSLIPLIFETDSSRVISLMIQDHGVVPSVEGVTSDQHSLSHHGQDEAKIEQLKRVELQLVEAFGGLLTDLGAKSDANGSLLDQTTVLFGSNLGNANAHTATDLPILVAGGGFSHGQHVVHEGENAPLCNLYVTMLQHLGVETDQFGQSTGTLTWS